MTIETKFKIGDTVWFMRDNKTQNAGVQKIDITVTEKGNHEVCTVTLVNPLQLHVSYLFPTKEALLASL